MTPRACAFPNLGLFKNLWRAGATGLYASRQAGPKKAIHRVLPLFCSLWSVTLTLSQVVSACAALGLLITRLEGVLPI